MGFGGDPSDIRAIAQSIRSWADDVDDDAASVRRAKDIDWKSTAAASFIDKIESRYQDTIGVANSMRDAADKVDHLADALEDRQHVLMDLLEKAGKTLADAEQMARDGVTDILDSVGSLADEAKQKAEDLLGDGKKLITSLGGLL